MTTDAVPDREFTGKLTAINSAVDQCNAQRQRCRRRWIIRITLCGRACSQRSRWSLPEKGPALVIPGSAVSYAPFGDSVFVIEKKKDEKTGEESRVLRQQFVRMGEARGDFVSITKGLEAGQEIVSAGVFKLRNGNAGRDQQ